MKSSKRQPKGSIAAQLEAEARRLAGGISENERKILSVALEKGKELEPKGRLAGPSA